MKKQKIKWGGGGVWHIIILCSPIKEEALEILEQIASKPHQPQIILASPGADNLIEKKSLLGDAKSFIMKGRSLSRQFKDVVQAAIGEKQSRIEMEIERMQLFSLFDGIDEPIYVSDPQSYEVLFANKALKSLFGEVIGRKCYEAFQGFTSPCPFCTNEKIFGENVGKSYVWEFQNKHNKRWYRCIDKAIPWPDGRMVRYEIAIDITDRKEAEEALRREEAFFESALTTLQDIFFVFERDGRFLRWNRRLTEVTGYSDEEISKLSARDLHSREDADKFQAAIDKAEGGIPGVIEIEILTKQGKRVPYELSVDLIRDSEGNPKGVCCVGRDIQSRKRTEEALRNVVRETNERREEVSALLECTRHVLEHIDFAEASWEILNLSRRLTGAREGFVSVVTEEGKQELLVTEPEELLKSLGRTGLMPITEPFREVYKTGKAFFQNEFPQSPLAEKVPEKHIGIENILVIPLMIENKPGGFICLTNKPGGFTNRDALMGSAFGEIAALGLRNSLTLKNLEEERTRFRSVAESAYEAILIADSNGNVIFLNRGAEKMFGYSAQELLGKPFTTILPESERKARLESFSRAITEESIEENQRVYELSGLRKGGEEFPIELSRSTWKVGGTSFCTFIIRDISERKEAEEALRKSQAEYMAVVEDQTELISRQLPDGRLTFVNEALCRFLGLKRDELIGRTLAEFVHPEDLREARRALASVSPESPSGSVECRFLRADGSYRWMRWTIRGIFDEEGHLAERQIVGRDVTELHEFIDALRISEERYRKLVESLPDVVYTISEDGILTSLNPAFEQITGWTRNDWIGKSFVDLVHPEDLPKAMETFVEASKGRLTSPYELRIRTKAGEYIVGEFMSAPLSEMTGEKGEFGVARDITERKRAEEALLASEQFYRALVELLPDAVTVTDLEGKITYASERTAEIHGFDKPEELIGRSAFEFFVPEEMERAKEVMRETLKKGSQRQVEFLLLRKDGSSFTGDISSSVLRDPTGEPVGFIAITRDITERKNAEEKLQALNIELEGYAHAVSHDLKGPLTSMLAASAIIQNAFEEKGKIDSEQYEMLREAAWTIEENVKKSSQLIDELLLLAEAEQKPSSVGDVDIGKVVLEILSERKFEIESRNVTVKMDKNLGKVRANPVQIYQIFSNLIDNAIKHNDKINPEVKVSYLGKDDKGIHKFIVSDNGPGIPEEDLENIFMPFYSGKEGKTGIGLATVDKIVRAYGGEIRAYNRRGANFEFTLKDYW